MRQFTSLRAFLRIMAVAMLPATKLSIVPLSANGELTVNVNRGPFGVGVPLSEIRGVVLGYFD